MCHYWMLIFHHAPVILRQLGNPPRQKQDKILAEKH